MNPMLMALKKKMSDKKETPEIDIQISHDDHMKAEPKEDDMSGPAPDLDSHEDEKGVMEHGVQGTDEHLSGEMQPGHDEEQDPSKYEGSLLHTSILKGLGDHGAQGRGPMKLGERAATGIKEKLAAIAAMKNKKS